MASRTIAKFRATMTGTDLREAYRELRAREAEQIEKLITAAIGLLHHDTTEGSDVDRYERMVLRQKFNEILHQDK